jgi:beta-ribofuranosylaminobenzene 5'-phosphate synthase
MSAYPRVDEGLRVTVAAPARLHMGFLDLGAALGRRFGSIGVGINEIATRVTLSASERWDAQGPGADRALRAAEKIASAVDLPCRAAIQIHEAIPGHVGLGSGTQLGLAVGMGLCRLYGLPLGVRDVARLVERGARSGIGVAVFEQGGLVVDGGRGERTVVPPLIARLEVPSEWRFLLVLDEGDQGLHGKDEVEAFRSLPVFPPGEAAHLCHLVLMRALPALAERDLVNFGAAIAEIQRSVGDYFAPAQGGRFTSPDVDRAVALLRDRGAVGVGQSSWGPTGFCLVDEVHRAELLLAEVRHQFAHLPNLKFVIGSARNHGAEIAVERVAAGG